ncbi:MAG: hypothetical protein ACXVB0_03740 [Mucilaginibacter sp.]
MKNLPILLVFLVMLMFMCSCSRTIYTRDVLKSYQTSAEVLKDFGPPDEINHLGEDMDWNYYRDTVSLGKKLNNKDELKYPQINVHPDSAKNNISQHQKYIKFIIDPNSNIVGYKSNGVILTKRVKNGFFTVVLKILGTEVAAILFVAASIALTKN